jgi:hypothetical protein
MNSSTLMLAAGIGLMCWLMLRSQRRRFSRPPTSTITAKSAGDGHTPNLTSRARLDKQRFRERWDEGASQSASPPPPAELHAWQLQLHEQIRSASATIDTKLALLQRLIVRAEQAEAALDERTKCLADQSRPKTSVRAAIPSTRQPLATHDERLQG